MQHHQREIMRYLLRVAGDREDAADLFQETWLRAYRAYPRLDPQSDVRPWLYAIATNLCRNRFRDRVRWARLIVPDKEELAAADTIGKNHRFDHDSEGYTAVRIRELILGLPTRQREALYLRYFAGLGYGEIATAMECSEDNARANVSQAVKKIKAKW